MKIWLRRDSREPKSNIAIIIQKQNNSSLVQLYLSSDKNVVYVFVCVLAIKANHTMCWLSQGLLTWTSQSGESHFRDKANTQQTQN